MIEKGAGSGVGAPEPGFTNSGATIMADSSEPAPQPPVLNCLRCRSHYRPVLLDQRHCAVCEHWRLIVAGIRLTGIALGHLERRRNQHREGGQ